MDYTKIGPKKGSSLSTISKKKQINSQYIYIRYDSRKINKCTMKLTLKVKYLNSDKKEEFTSNFTFN